MRNTIGCDDMRYTILALALAALLLAGCTINPQDTAGPQKGGTQGNGQAAPGGGEGANASGGNASTDGGNGPGSGGQGDLRTFTLEEVAKHAVKGDCWMVIGGRVLNLSGYTTHPGGDTFVPYCGKDGTEGFATMGGKEKNHSASAYANIDNYVIGALGD